MRNALLRYRVMAYLVGTLLVVLTLIGLPLKYGYGDDRVVLWTGIPHGWLYMVLLLTAFDLGRRARWSWGRLLLIALAGTIPFLSFVAERSATRDVRDKLAREQQPVSVASAQTLDQDAAQPGAASPSPTPERRA